MSRRRHKKQFGSRDRIAAFARATEAYAETLEDPDLANVYWGKSLGLWQAFTILSTEPGLCGSHNTDCRPSATTRPAGRR